MIKKLLKKRLGYISIEIVIIAAIMLVSGFTAVGSFVEDGQKASNDAATKIDETLNLAGGGESVGPGGSGGGGELPEIPEDEPVTLEAGLYDKDDNLLASWDVLTNEYQIDFEAGVDVMIHGMNSLDIGSTPNTIQYLTENRNSPYKGQGVKLILKEGITQIGAYAFYGAGDLKEIVIPNTVTKIGEYAFSLSGIESIVIPNKISSIEDYTFSICVNLKKVSFSNSLVEIGKNAFERCYELQEINLPYGLSKIDEYAFRETGIVSVELPDSVTEIGYGIFYQCQSLESAKMSSGLTSLTKYIFSYSGIKELYIPKSITYIDSEFVTWCNTLEAVYYEGSEDEWSNVDCRNTKITNTEKQYNVNF